MYRVQNSLSISVYHDPVEQTFIEIWGSKTLDIKTDKTLKQPNIKICKQLCISCSVCSSTEWDHHIR